MAAPLPSSPSRQGGRQGANYASRAIFTAAAKASEAVAHLKRFYLIARSAL
jgi:hypothetical protein